ncbi:MAG: acyl-CoA dehydrogenase family protein [Hyphomicrobiales bacterium]
MSIEFRVEPGEASTRSLRAEVRAFIAAEKAAGVFVPRQNAWTRYNTEFSRHCGERGYIGMTWPRAYGGHERPERERFVMCEEMLAVGAPVGAHWIADRQSGGQILRFGSERLKRELLPPIAAGRCFFAIGMSEPDSGSDLASVRTRALRADGGWRIEGRKVWTTNAHLAHYLIALVRTSGPRQESDRRAGLTQMVVDLASPGIEIRPILNISGEREFNEVVFDGCFVPADHVLGAVGEGWQAVTNELALERSGPDRFLSLMPLMQLLVRAAAQSGSERAQVEVGRLLAHLAALRGMSASVATMIEKGGKPETEAALVKDVGTSFEQETSEIARGLLPLLPDMSEDADPLARAIAMAVLEAPSFTLRGGTREILRGIIARGLGAR